MTYEQFDKKCDNFRSNSTINQKAGQCTGFTFLKKESQ